MQYIGARYVPKFMGTFDATQAYENMCVVDNGLGTSYISVKPVPVGSSLLDTNYWAIYGASSGAIINLQNQIGDLTDLDTTDKDNLVDAINENASAIEAVKTRTNKKYIFIGDSYSQTYYTETGWMALLKNMLNLGSDHCFEYGVGGYGFIGLTPGTSTFISLLNQAYTDHSDIADEITDIIVLGGRNDATHAYEAGLITDIQTFVNTAATKFPNAIVHIGYCGMYFGTDITTNLQLYRLPDIYSSAEGRNVCNIKGLQHIARKTATYRYDDNHPTTAGETEIAKNVVSHLNGGGLSVATRETIGFTLADVDAHTHTGAIYYMQDNDGTITLFFDFTVDVSDITITLNGQFKIIELFDAPFKGIGQYWSFRRIIPVTVVYTDGGTKYHNMALQLEYKGGILYGTFDDSTFTHYADITSITPGRGTHVFPYRTI